MMDRLVSVAAVVILASAVATAAEQKPDFSGTWITVSPAEAAGQQQWIKQDDATLTTGHASEGDGHSFTYRLDGTETRQLLKTHDQDIVTLATAVWEGDRLVITRKTTYPDGRKRSARSVWMLDGDGHLVVESTEEVDGKSAGTWKIVSRKKS